MIGIVVVGALIGLRLMGLLGGGDEVEESPGSPAEISPTSVASSSRETVRDSGSNEISIDWKYRDKPFAYSFFIDNKTYNAFKSKQVGITRDMATGDVIAQYVVTDGDGGLVRGIADYILEQSEENGWGDYDTIMNTIACIEQFGPMSFKNTADDGDYKYPIETIWEEEGDREDMSILAASVLDYMGYPVAFMVFPEQYDRGYMIWEYPAVGIRCEETIDGQTYVSVNSVGIGTVTCYPQGRYYNLPGVPGFEPEYGYFTGNATLRYSDGQTVSAGEAVWDIPSGTLSYTGGFAPSPGEIPVICRMENASWVTSESYIFVNTLNSTAVPGEIPGELARAEPEIVTTLIEPENDITICRDDRIDSSMEPSLRKPSVLEARTEIYSSISEDLGIPVSSGLVAEINEANRGPEEEYWENIWYDTSVNLYEQTWYLDVMEYEVIEDQLLYTKSNEIYVSPAAAWRIRCEARPLDPPDNDLEGISSFSDIRIAVYKVDEEGGSAKRIKEISFGYKTGQENVEYLNVYETGNFYIATFVRNCEAEISIQIHGKGVA